MREYQFFEAIIEEKNIKAKSGSFKIGNQFGQS
jgi:hypothetical protein